MIYDCIIGAGPGGLPAAIYLGSYNRKALLIDRGGGRKRRRGCDQHQVELAGGVKRDKTGLLSGHQAEKRTDS